MIELRKHLSGFRKMNTAVAQIERDPALQAAPLPLPAPVKTQNQNKTLNGGAFRGAATTGLGNLGHQSSLLLPKEQQPITHQAHVSVGRRTNLPQSRQSENFSVLLGKRNSTSNH